jgi:hypothetical protein
MSRKSLVRSSSVSRREFGRRVALAAGAGIVAADLAAGADPTLHAHGGHRESLDRSGQTPPNLSEAGRVRFDSMWENVLRKHGDRLDDDQKARMRKIITNNVKLLEAVYAVALTNGDTPATTLRLLDGQRPSPTHAPSSAPRAGAPRNRRPSPGAER